MENVYLFLGSTIKFSEYTNVQMVPLLVILSIIKDENSIRKRALWAKMKKLGFFSKLFCECQATKKETGKKPVPFHTWQAGIAVCLV